MTVWLWIWAWLASFTAIMMALRAQRWMNRWYEQGEQYARALDTIAYLKEALAQNPQAAHTALWGQANAAAGVHYGPTGHRPPVEVPLVQPGTTPRVVPPGGLQSGDWSATTGQPVPGLSPAGGFGAPGAAPEGRGDRLEPGDDLTVVGSVSGKVRALRPPAEPDEIPY
jgi:hypothetical protein